MTLEEICSLCASTPNPQNCDSLNYFSSWLYPGYDKSINCLGPSHTLANTSGVSPLISISRSLQYE